MIVALRELDDVVCFVTWIFRCTWHDTARTTVLAYDIPPAVSFVVFLDGELFFVQLIERFINVVLGVPPFAYHGF